MYGDRGRGKVRLEEKGEEKNTVNNALGNTLRNGKRDHEYIMERGNMIETRSR